MPLQREDITLDERMRMVTTLLSQPNHYGLVSHFSHRFQISRQSIYTMLKRSQQGLAQSLLARPPGRAQVAQTLTVNADTHR